MIQYLFKPFTLKALVLFLMILLSVVYKNAFSQTLLTPGDMVIIGFSSSGGDDAVKLATLVDLTCGTQFVITDNNWKNNSSSWPCNDDEFALRITITQKVCAGSIFYIVLEGGSGTINISSGAATRTGLEGNWGDNYGINSGGDNLHILTGTNASTERSSPNFIYSLKHNGNFSNTTDCDKDNTGLPTALSVGSTAIVMDDTEDKWSYNCANRTSGTKAQLLADISNKSNWSSSSSLFTRSGSLCSGTSSFTVTSPCTPPTHTQSNFATTSITSTSGKINWDYCSNGGSEPANTKVLVIAREGAAVSTAPTSGTTYSASLNFGSGTAIGAGYVVYSGNATNNAITISNLNQGTTYHFAIYEVSCNGNCYSLTNLPGQFTTDLPLEVNLVYFTASVLDGSQIIFEWLSSFEKDNKHFEIEGSVDGNLYTTIGKVNALEKIEGLNKYSYLWESNESFQYFRLKQVDIYEVVTFSAVEYLSAISIDYQIMPNPASRELYIKINTTNTSSENIEVKVVDITGKELIQNSIQLSDTNTMYSLPIDLLATGTYFLVIASETKVIRKKFIKN